MKNQKSRSVLKRVTGAALVLLAGAGILGQDALAGIVNTKHNLSSTSTSTATRNNTFKSDGGSGEICVFCHTPHGADTSASVPLWNRKLGAQGGATYTTYNSLGTSSLDGATAPVGSVSLACLSCHDGTQAMNTMINQPGSGGYDPNGSLWAGTWDNKSHIAVDGSGNATGKLGGTNNVALIGVDLRNDHPIGIQYGGGPKTTIPALTASSTNYEYKDFKDADFNKASGALLNGNPVWWVDTGTTGSGTREKSDMQLYTRSDQTYLDVNGATVKGEGGAELTLAGAQPFVECASCHDPHTENVTFLRMTDGNKNSQVCLACHNK